jgi:hypothetical protein
MATALTFIGALVVFLAIYAAIHRRAGRTAGEPRPIQWGWLAAVIACAAVAVIIGALAH